MDLKASPSKDSPASPVVLLVPLPLGVGPSSLSESQLRTLPAGRTVQPRLDVDPIVLASIEALRGQRVGYLNAGGAVMEPLDVPWCEPRSPTVSVASTPVTATAAA